MSTPIVRRRKRPVEVDTMQWLGDNEADLIAFTNHHFEAVPPEDRVEDPEITAQVYDVLHSSWIGVKTGQHIARGVKNEHYPIDDGDILAKTYEDADTPLHAGCRTDTLAEVTAWLVKKAREFHADSRKREREQGDTCAVLASKIARGAVRPDNLRMLPDAGFFEVGGSYVSGTWQFRCEAITPSPGTGEIRALGWKRSPVHDVHLWHAAALDPDDWKHGAWTDVTEAGDR